MAEQIPIGLRVSLDAEEAERTLVRFLRDYAGDAGRPRFVVGMSGGLDSALAATIACRAVGPKNVRGLVLPEKRTPPDDIKDGKLVMDWLGMKSTTQSIHGIVEAVAEASGDLDKAARGNVKARARMILLHAEAARREALVLGTGNKSELLTGYFSKFGDAGVDLQPLGDLYKTQVRILAKHLGISKRIIARAPSAGLWDNQTDEGELGVTYDVLDRILLGMELRLPADRIAQIVQVPRSEIDRIEALRRNSQHKRRTPIIPRIGLRTVGMDWRMPTLES